MALQHLHKQDCSDANMRKELLHLVKTRCDNIMHYDILRLVLESSTMHGILSLYQVNSPLVDIRQDH